MITISSEGGTIYLKEGSGNIEYSLNSDPYVTISTWPVTIVNTNPNSSKNKESFITLILFFIK